MLGHTGRVVHTELQQARTQPQPPTQLTCCVWHIGRNQQPCTHPPTFRHCAVRCILEEVGGLADAAAHRGGRRQDLAVRWHRRHGGGAGAAHQAVHL